jgi:hypothetical protein
MTAENKPEKPRPDFDGVREIARRLRELKIRKRELLRGDFPDDDALAEIQRTIKSLLKRKTDLDENTRKEIRSHFGREERPSLETALLPFAAAFCTDSGTAVDAPFGRSRRILVFNFTGGALESAGEIPRAAFADAEAGHAAARLQKKFPDVRVIFAKRFTKEEDAAFAAAGILAVQSRPADFEAAILAHRDRIRFFLES